VLWLQVADLGLSRLLDVGRTHLSTRACGTISHSPPELILQGQLRPAADVYAFGMMCESIGGAGRVLMQHRWVTARVMPRLGIGEISTSIHGRCLLL
jgi:serine/threonine protein kinase